MFEKVSGLNKVIDTVTVNQNQESSESLRPLVELLVHQVTPKKVSTSVLEADVFKAPNRKTLKEIIDLLRKLVFGASLEDDGDALRCKLSVFLNQASMLLEEQILRALLQVSDDEATSKARNRSKEITATFFESLPKVRMLILRDVDACFKGDPAAKSPLEIILAYPGIEAIFVYRLAHILHQLQVPLIPRMMSEICHSRTAIDIHPGATIGCPFFIDHGTGVVVGETATIGNNVTLFHNVTLGAISTSAGQALSGTKRHPTIEDDVTIYAGAAVLGGRTVIGKGSVVGAGLVVWKSIPPNHVVKQLATEHRYAVVPRKPPTEVGGFSFSRDFSEATTAFGRDESVACRMATETDFSRMESDFCRLQSDFALERLESDVQGSFNSSETCNHSFSPLIKKNSQERVALLEHVTGHTTPEKCV